ncbi:hypothetical protein GS504_03450 [Rhodococcus hoagii]|nr:hypothetical protein [Prescottella equi]NKS56612.1 hypothetical protein [Prescottella equi]
MTTHLQKAMRMNLSRLRHTAIAVAVVATVGLATACGSSGDQQSDSTLTDTSSAPADVQWASYRGVAVPTSSTDGPTNTDAVVPNGYAQTPQGAVIAAIQGQARLALAPDNSWAQTAQVVAAPGSGRDAYAVARAMASITEEADPAQTAQFVGFRFTDYSKDAGTVWLATRMPDGALSASPTRMVWQGGDWKVELSEPSTSADDAATPTDPIPLTSLDDYVAFSATH